MSDSLVDIIKSRNISDIISNYIKLKPLSQHKWKGLCPFHKEKTPSFNVNDQEGYYKCFGCGEGGDVIAFLMKIKNIDFQSAIDVACEGYNINKSHYNTIKQSVEKQELKNDFYHKMAQIAQKWKKNLETNKNAFYYLKNKRHLTQETIDFFQIGFCNKNETLSEFDTKGLGLHSVNNYLLLSNRITFPIQDKKGNIISFGGRVVDDGLPKYINSGENEFFKKSDVLFNLHNAIKNKNANNNIIIVEGYLDVITAYQNSIKTAVAPLGTSITEEHIKQILKYDKKPIFAFDSDQAGLKASLRAVILLLKMLDVGVIPSFLVLHNVKDLDEFLNKNKSNNIKKIDYDIIKDMSIEIQDYIVNIIVKNHNLKNPNEMAIALKEVDEMVERINNKNLQSNYRFYIKNQLYQQSKINSNTTKIDINKNEQKLDSIEEIEAKIVSLITLLNIEGNHSIIEKYFDILKSETQNKINQINTNSQGGEIESKDLYKLEFLFIELELERLKSNKNNMKSTVFQYERKNILEKKKNLLNKVEKEYEN
jgi:DNA primase